MTNDLDQPEYDDGYSDEEESHILGAATIGGIQQKALMLFGQFVERISGVSMPPEIPLNAEKFLPINELKTIINDYAVEMPAGGWAVGADTKEDATKKLRSMVDAVLQRILSNVMSEGVHKGWLDCEFNSDTNLFDFSLTDEGRKMSKKSRAD